MQESLAKEAAEETEAILDAVRTGADHLPPVPILITGDFNATVEHTGVLRDMTATAG